VQPTVASNLKAVVCVFQFDLFLFNGHRPLCDDQSGRPEQSRPRLIGKLV
jgi:hypothetical protein